ncbi:MAG: hypothetical protein HYY30_05655 [Chloroflexi bacterium]|nr:hypothetical protein [Chloroflexota bacterium]
MVTQTATRCTALLVSHTHWDREWYLPFQRFRIRLVDLIDQLLDILDNEPDYRYFTLDGQTIVLEDYLEIRPENRERLARYIRSGRILVGPWYVLPDEFLVSPEALVRNLMLGHRIAQDFGGVMPVGYLPDTFGHPAQIPQILRGFDLDCAVIYRGVQTETADFLWEAPDGSRAITTFLPGGYCNAMQLTAAPWRFLDRLEQIVTTVKSMAATDTFLLMNGCDHLPPQRQILQVIDEANDRLDGNGNGGSVRLEQGTLPQYFEHLRGAKAQLPVIKGEFRKPRPGRVLPGVVSARMYLKQENFRSANALERYAEPLSALAWALGSDYPQPFLRQAWKHLIQNHPHDSICGCSVDEVHRDMMARFRWTQEIAQDLTYRAAEALAGRVAKAGDADEATFIAFNPLPQLRRDYVAQYINFFDIGQEFHLRDHRGQVVPHQVIGRQRIWMNYDPFTRRIELEGRRKPSMMGVAPSELDAIVQATVWRQWRGEEVEVLVAPSEIPPCGYTAYSLVLGKPTPRHSEACDDVASANMSGGNGSALPLSWDAARSAVVSTDLRVGEDYVENDLLKVIVRPDGALDIVDKRDGATFSGLNVFESKGDAGDEYTCCPPEQDTVVTSRQFPPRITMVESGPVRATFEIRYEMLLPRGLTEDRTQRSAEMILCPLTVKVALAVRTPRIEVRAELDNSADDAILRVLFPTTIQSEWSFAQGQFEVVQRPVAVAGEELEVTPGPDEEVPVNTYPQRNFVDVNDDQKGLAILNKGLAEYEVIPGSDGVTVALTLLRSVGWLSRPDLATRNGNAGPFVPAPDAQCHGSQVFEYAILPHRSDWRMAEVQQEAERYVALPTFTALRNPAGHLPLEHSFVVVEPADLVLSALKKAEEDDALILRVYNVASHLVLARVRFGLPVREVRQVNLNEQDIDAKPLFPDEHNTIVFPVEGHQIRTVKVRVM